MEQSNRSKVQVIKNKILDYLKVNFNKKNNLNRLLFFVLALILVLIPSLTMLFWSLGQTTNIPLGTNGFWYVHLTLNSGVGFSLFGNSPVWVVYLVQWLTNIIVLIIILFSKQWYYILALSFALCGGSFNVIQRAIPQTAIWISSNPSFNTVVDYFSFGFMSFAIFNFPDMFIVCGILGFCIMYISRSIYIIVKEQKEENNAKKDDTSKKSN